MEDAFATHAVVVIVAVDKGVVIVQQGAAAINARAVDATEMTQRRDEINIMNMVEK